MLFVGKSKWKASYKWISQTKKDKYHMFYTRWCDVNEEREPFEEKNIPAGEATYKQSSYENIT